MTASRFVNALVDRRIAVEGEWPRSDDPGPSIWAKNRGWTPLLLSHTRDYGLYLESLLELQWGAVTRPRFGFMRTAEIVYTSGG